MRKRIRSWGLDRVRPHRGELRQAADRDLHGLRDKHLDLFRVEARRLGLHRHGRGREFGEDVVLRALQRDEAVEGERKRESHDDPWPAHRERDERGLRAGRNAARLFCRWDQSSSSSASGVSPLTSSESTAWGPTTTTSVSGPMSSITKESAEIGASGFNG